MNNTRTKWLLTILGGLAAGIVAYGQIKESAPRTYDDFWKLLQVSLTTGGIATGVQAARKGMDKAAKDKDQ